MKPSTRLLHEAHVELRLPIPSFDLALLRAEYADLMDQCADAVTLCHGLDLDDVILERFALVGAPGIAPEDCYEVAIPFLADHASVINAIREQVLGVDSVIPSTNLEFKRLSVWVFLETGSPLFKQAGNDPENWGSGDEHGK